MPSRRRIGEVLMSQGAIDEAALKKALGHQIRWGGKVGRILVEMGATTSEAVGRALAAQAGLEFSDLAELPPPEVAKALPVDLAERSLCVLLKTEGTPPSQTHVVAVADPWDGNLQNDLHARFGKTRIVVAGEEPIRHAIARLYRGNEPEAAAAALEMSEDGSLEIVPDPVGGFVEPAPSPPPTTRAAPAASRPAASPAKGLSPSPSGPKRAPIASPAADALSDDFNFLFEMPAAPKGPVVGTPGPAFPKNPVPAPVPAAAPKPTPRVAPASVAPSPPSSPSKPAGAVPPSKAPVVGPSMDTNWAESLDELIPEPKPPSSLSPPTLLPSTRGAANVSASAKDGSDEPEAVEEAVLVLGEEEEEPSAPKPAEEVTEARDPLEELAEDIEVDEEPEEPSPTVKVSPELLSGGLGPVAPKIDKPPPQNEIPSKLPEPVAPLSAKPALPPPAAGEVEEPVVDEEEPPPSPALETTELDLSSDDQDLAERFPDKVEEPAPLPGPTPTPEPVAQSPLSETTDEALGEIFENAAAKAFGESEPPAPSPAPAPAVEAGSDVARKAIAALLAGQPLPPEALSYAEYMFTAVLRVLRRKGLITEAELLEELLRPPS